MKNRHNILQRFLFWFLSVFLVFSLCACETSPSEDKNVLIKLPEEDDYYQGEGEEGYSTPRRKRRRPSRRSSGGGGSSTTTPTTPPPPTTPTISCITPVNVSQLNQISALMAGENYEEASRLSRCVSPELSALIEAGNYAGASLLLGQILASLGR